MIQERNCIFIALSDGKVYITRESELSRFLSLKIGDLLPSCYIGPVHLDSIKMTAEQMRTFREDLSLTVEGFAFAYGLTVEHVLQIEVTGEG